MTAPPFTRRCTLTHLYTPTFTHLIQNYINRAECNKQIYTHTLLHPYKTKLQPHGTNHCIAFHKKKYSHTPIPIHPPAPPENKIKSPELNETRRCTPILLYTSPHPLKNKLHQSGKTNRSAWKKKVYLLYTPLKHITYPVYNPPRLLIHEGVHSHIFAPLFTPKTKLYLLGTTQSAAWGKKVYTHSSTPPPPPLKQGARQLQSKSG